MGEPLSKASSGQALDGLSNHPSSARRSLPAIGTDLPDPEAVLANEAFRRASSGNLPLIFSALLGYKERQLHPFYRTRSRINLKFGN